ncbi:mechanosensitive ion channel family protein [Haloferacaceae archaeon DSL9]
MPIDLSFLHEYQYEYFLTTEGQLLGTVLLGVLFGFGIYAVRYSESLLRSRFDNQLTEAIQTATTAVLVVAAALGLAVIWNVAIVVEFVVSAAAADRWTVMRQVMTVVVFVVAYLIVRVVNRSIDKLAQVSAITKHQSEIAYHVADVGIFLVAFSIVLALWNFDLSSVFISAGALSVVIGLAARETLSAMVAGFVLLFSRPFMVGDWIEINGQSGIVTDVTIFNTKIQTFRDEHVLVPNDEITSSQLVNFSKNSQLRVELTVGVDYATDLERAQTVIVDAIEGIDDIKSTPKPDVIARAFGDSAIDLEVRFWISEPTMRRKLDTQTKAIQRIKAAFERDGISIPFPQRVHEFRNEAKRDSAGAAFSVDADD